MNEAMNFILFVSCSLSSQSDYVLVVVDKIYKREEGCCISHLPHVL